MQIYNLYHIMLKGKEAGHRYFVTITVIGCDYDKSIEVALNHAQKLGYEIIGIEEVEEEPVRTEIIPLSEKYPKIVKVYGRSFFKEE